LHLSRYLSISDGKSRYLSCICQDTYASVMRDAMGVDPQSILLLFSTSVLPQSRHPSRLVQVNTLYTYHDNLYSEEDTAKEDTGSRNRFVL